MKLNVGIAGYGIIGKRRHIYIDQNESLNTVAVCDQNFKSIDVIKNGIVCYPNYKDLLNRNDLDVIFISLPNYLAPEVTVKSLEKGLHVFCEKPPSKTVEEVNDVLETKKKYPLQKLKYGFNHRYHQSVKDAYKIYESKELGEIINLRGVYGKNGYTSFSNGWRSKRKYSGGGILLDQGIHMVDLIRHFCGNFDEVHSFISNKYWNCDVEDNAYSIMKNEKGQIAMLHSSATHWQHKFSLNIFLTEGYLILSGFLTSSKSYGQEKLIIGKRNNLPTGTNKEEIITYVEDNSFQDEINEFVLSIINDTQIQSGSIYDALSTMKLVYKIYYSDKKWRNLMKINNPNI